MRGENRAFYMAVDGGRGSHIERGTPPAASLVNLHSDSKLIRRLNVFEITQLSPLASAALISLARPLVQIEQGWPSHAGENSIHAAEQTAINRYNSAR